MFPTDQPTAASTLPAPAAAGTQGFFTNGSPATGVPATILDADFLNMLQQELINVATAGGQTPSKTAYNQITLAIQALIKAAGQGISSTGNISTTGKINGTNNPNLVFNGSGEFGSVGWALGSFSNFVDTSGEIGSFFSHSGALTAYTFAVAGQQFPIGPGQNVCMAMDVSNGASGSVQISLAAYTSAGGYISNIGTSAIPNSSLARYSTTAVTPANTAYVVPQLVLNGVASTAFGIVFRRVKVEQGTIPSLYSQEPSIAALAGALPAVGSVRNLKASLAAAGTSLTVTADEICVGAALGGFKYTLGSFSQTVSTTSTGIGGVVGTALAANGFAGIYAAFNPSTGQQGIFAVNANSAIPNVAAAPPAGWIGTGLIGVWPLNGSTQFKTGLLVDRDLVFVLATAYTTSAVVGSLSGVSIATIVPPNARAIVGELAASSTASSNVAVGVSSDSNGSGQQNFTQTGLGGASNFNLKISQAQAIYFSSSNSAGTPTFNVYIVGYSI